MKARTTLALFLISVSFSLFGQDGTLDDYLQAGIANSPVLLDLANQVQASRYDSLVTRAGYLPQFGFNGQLMYAPTMNGWGYSDVITNGQSLLGTLNVSQQIFNKASREAGLEKYAVEGAGRENSRNISIRELKKAITAQYLTAFSAYAEMKYQEELLTALREELEIVRRLAESGIYRQNDYLVLKIEAMALERNTQDLALQYRTEFSNLNLICGIADTAVVPLTIPDLQEITSFSPRTSPLFRRFYYDSLQIVNEKRLIDLRYRPSISWFSDGGLVNNLPGDIYKNFGISFGLSMNLPVYDGNQRRLNYGKLQAMEETRKGYEDFFRLQHSTRLRQLGDELSKVRHLADESEKQVELVSELIVQDKALLKAGSLPVLEYILALKNLSEVRHSLLLYRIRALYIINEINFLTL